MSDSQNNKTAFACEYGQVEIGAADDEEEHVNRSGKPIKEFELFDAVLPHVDEDGTRCHAGKQGAKLHVSHEVLLE